jgi:hypothetical protein
MELKPKIFFVLSADLIGGKYTYSLPYYLSAETPLKTHLLLFLHSSFFRFPKILELTNESNFY